MTYHQLTEKISEVKYMKNETDKIIRQWLTERCENYWEKFPTLMKLEAIEKMKSRFGLTKTSCEGEEKCKVDHNFFERMRFKFCPSCGEKLGAV